VSETLSSETLDEIERRCAAATAGPWKSWWEGRDHGAGDSVITTGSEDIYLTGGTMADQDFIAHARQDVPVLIQEVRTSELYSAAFKQNGLPSVL
jgi:hypothetical protein